jgi:hypothetical protein
VKRCTQRVPQALCGPLSPLPQCTLTTPTGTHTGEHRARLVMVNVGKVVFKWKGARRKIKPPPPIISFGAKTNPYLTGQLRKEPICECPGWWKEQGSKMHHSPCVRV